MVMSVGLPIARKGILDFLALAEAFPQVTFFWFGALTGALLPPRIKHALQQAPDNVQTAKDLILRKYSRKLQQEDGRQKVMAALARRGFGYHDIQAALEQLEDEEYL